MKRFIILFICCFLCNIQAYAENNIDQNQALKEAKERVGVQEDKSYQEIDLQLTQPAKVFQINFQPEIKNKNDIKYDKKNFEDPVPNRVILNRD